MRYWITLLAVMCFGCTTFSMMRQPAAPTTQEGCQIAIERERIMFRAVCDQGNEEAVEKCYLAADNLKLLAEPGCLELPKAGEASAE